MEALVYTGPEALEVRDVARPEAAGECVVAVEACGICGSDMHAYLGHDPRRPAPLVLGHEAAGTVVEGPRKGERVTINPLVTCGTCPACTGGRSNLCRSRQIISMPPRPGAFAELVRIPERNLVTLPDGMPFLAAALTEPMATGYHAVAAAARLSARPLASLEVAVLGGGAIGLGVAYVLRHFGAGRIVVVEPNALRRATLERLGIAEVVEADAALADSSVEVVVDAVGIAATRAASSRIAAPGGVIVHVGLGDNAGGLDTRKCTLQEITFLGTYTYTMADFRETLELIGRGVFGDLDWVERRALGEGSAAFRALRRGEVAAAKIVLCPGG
ncbi:MAG: alcohol dehydrogenase catalytic domain-containing protein [Rhizobiales bacterium]|nr:alcohol dehydrogenase catalytic domain-containing protein [Hyphomicrobiales bacterium]